MAMFNKFYATPTNLTELEILKTIRTALYEVGYPGTKYLERLQIIAVIYQLYRAKDLARELQKKVITNLKTLLLLFTLT